MKARVIIDRLVDRGDEYSFPHILSGGDWDGVKVEVTYRAVHHDREDHKITGQPGTVDLVDVASGGRSVLTQLPAELIEQLAELAMEHYADHVNDVQDEVADRFADDGD